MRDITRSLLTRLDKLTQRQPRYRIRSIWDLLSGSSDPADLDDLDDSVKQAMATVPDGPVPDEIEARILHGLEHPHADLLGSYALPMTEAEATVYGLRELGPDHTINHQPEGD